MPSFFPNRLFPGLLLTGALLLPCSPGAAQQQVQSAPAVQAIRPPTNPIPAEEASAGVTKFSFIAYGDTRGRRDGVDPQYEHSLVIDAMLRTISSMANGPEPVRFVLQSGDAVVNGRNPRQWNESFVALINRITTEAGLPFFLAAGNHDVTGSANVQAPSRQEGLRNYLSAVAELIPPDGATRRLAGYPTYAFGYGNTFFIAFDSNIAEDSTQFAWVTAQLEGLDRTRYPNIIANFHHPVYSSGPHGGPVIERPTMVLRERWMPLFRRHGVKLLLVGHEHLFEHWVERYRDAGGTQRRLDQIVSGGGGAPLYAYTGEPSLTAYQRADPAARVRVQHLVKPGPDAGDNPYHFVVVHVDGSSIWVEVVGVDWGSGFAPYRSSATILADTAALRMR
jgi:3',5'-cyclic AMP phosphodiesterase CpdA